MAQTSSGVDDAVEELGSPVIHSEFRDVLLRELKLLTKFLQCLSKFEGADEDVNLTIAKDTLRVVMKEAGFGFPCILDNVHVGLRDSDAQRLLNQFEKFKPQIEKICALTLHSIKAMSFGAKKMEKKSISCFSTRKKEENSMSCSIRDIRIMVDYLVNYFMDLSKLNASIVVSVKDQTLILAERLRFLSIFLFCYTERCTDQLILKDFLDYVKDLVHDALLLSLFGLLKGKDEIMAQGWLPDLQLQRFMPPILAIITVSKASKLSRTVHFFVAASLVDFLLQVSPDSLKDYNDILKEELIIMITFLIDPAEAAITNDGDEIFTPVAAIEEVLSLFSSLYINKLSVDVSSLLEKASKVKAWIRMLYVPSLNSSNFSFPRTNVIGLIDLFMEKLKDVVKHHSGNMPYVKHQLFMVQDKFISLEPFLKSIMQLQKEIDLEELKDLWERSINLIFQADHVVSSCLIIDHPIWHDMLRLTEVANALKIIEIEVRYYDDQINKKILPDIKIDSSQVLIKQTKPSSLEDVVGLEDEKKSIIDHLKRGTKHLDIVSIFGMPGIGKTTLAQKVYTDESIRYHFCRRAWCCVSQMYNRRELFFEILTDVIGANTRKYDAKLTDDDLANKLRKSLKQQRYLIVLDDIWDIKAWDIIKDSFPNDYNGSRIIFTSRIHNLGPQAKPDCYLHQVRQLSEYESWELLKMKLSHTHSFLLDDEEAEIGKQIVKKCKGIPLTVVLVAGILQGKSIKFWKDIKSHVSEGCMDVLKLSYNHLPENLKPCFLYFGAFPEDRIIRTKKLLSLWIGEGFIPRNDKLSSYKIAEDYLSDLINRNLVIPVGKNSIGSIRACRIHDLLHDFCMTVAREDKFLQRVDEGDDLHSSCDSRKYENYRLFIRADWTKFVDAKSYGRYIRSIVLLCDGGWNEFPRDFLNSFRLVNVLDLERITKSRTFPEEVTLMVNLRYLGIFCRTGCRLPQTIAKLWNLEILIISSDAGQVMELPGSFWQMKKLRRVSISEVRIAESLEYNQYGRLEHLEIFSNAILAHGNHLNELIKRLPRLRKFKCIFRYPSISIRPHAMFPTLSSLAQVESLHLRKSYLNVDGYWFPALDFPNSLRKLILKDFSLPWAAISIIGKLPNLEVLKLRCNAFSGRWWNVEDGEFQALKFLELNDLDIEEWSVQDDPFPLLELLVVCDCGKLREIPSGFENIPTLRKIGMRRCSSRAAMSVEEILKEQKDKGNDVLQIECFSCYL